MSEKQKTIKSEVKISGVGLHTGHKANIILKPALDNQGIRFIRLDLADRPVIKVEYNNVLVDAKVPRCTSIGFGEQTIHTVEHFMSVLSGLGIDNLIIEIDNNELPGLDGSGIEFLNRIRQAGIVEQKEPRDFFRIKEAVGVERDGASIVVLPANDFKVSYTLNYEHPFLRSQFFSATITPQTYEKELASCRTFCLEKEAEELKKHGLGKGANYENTLVVGEKGVIKNTLRFENEFARHKILDFIGDLYLLGKPVHGHVYAIKSGHTLNLALLKEIYRQLQRHQSDGFIPGYDISQARELDIREIMKILPHRYPFLLVDKVIEIEKGKKAIGIKNVTMNDQFFQGHFPTKPMMPGVLMVEAMAQTAGIVVLTSDIHRGNVALFMATDNVKFRKVVVPGDQLIMEVEVIRDRTKTAQIHCQARVGQEIVAEADMLFSFTDASYLA